MYKEQDSNSEAIARDRRKDQFEIFVMVFVVGTVVGFLCVSGGRRPVLSVKGIFRMKFFYNDVLR